MDNNAFIADLVGSAVDLIVGLGWPAALLTVIVILRRQIGDLIGRLATLKGFGAEATFDRASERARKATAAARAEAVKTGTIKADAVIVRPDLVGRLADVAEADPLDAIRRGYAEVEAELRRRLEAVGVNHRQIDRYQLIDEALVRGLISAKTAEAVRGLIVLRDLSATGTPAQLGVESALDFLTLCDGVIYAITAGVPSGGAATPLADGMVDSAVRRWLVEVVFENAMSIVQERHMNEVRAADEAQQRRREEFRRQHGREPGPEDIAYGGPGAGATTGPWSERLEGYYRMAEEAQTREDLAALVARIVLDAQQQFGTTG